MSWLRRGRDGEEYPEPGGTVPWSVFRAGSYRPVCALVRIVGQRLSAFQIALRTGERGVAGVEPIADDGADR